MSKMKFQVVITEKLEMTVEVEADTPQQAEQIVSDGWRDGEYVLDYDNFTDVVFKSK